MKKDGQINMKTSEKQVKISEKREENVRSRIKGQNVAAQPASSVPDRYGFCALHFPASNL